MSTVDGEIGEQPEVLARLVARTDWEPLARRVAAHAPEGALTVARGSSDHAAAYFAYLVLVHLGLPVASLPPSVMTLYDRRPRGEGRVAIGVSQSGRSPDVIRSLETLRASGALTLAVTNEPGSPLAAAADATVALGCGPERAVAATKTFTASLAALAAIALRWAGRADLVRALEALPEAARRALAVPVDEAASALTGAADAFVLGRAFGYAVALEAALKLKEVARLRAEGASAAEFLHGPVASVDPGLPVIVVVSSDPPARGPCLEAASRIGRAGGKLVLVGASPEEGKTLGAVALDVGRGLPGEVAAIVQAIVLQRLAVAAARARGHDPDAPRNLVKVTETW
jgi:glucosamine--fructose-6-phosphate aminotransferase (isomerizing)